MAALGAGSRAPLPLVPPPPPPALGGSRATDAALLPPAHPWHNGAEAEGAGGGEKAGEHGWGRGPVARSGTRGGSSRRPRVQCKE